MYPAKHKYYSSNKYRQAVSRQFEKTAGKEKILKKIIEIGKTSPAKAEYYLRRYNALIGERVDALSGRSGEGLRGSIGAAFLRVSKNPGGTPKIFELLQSPKITKTIPIKGESLIISKSNKEILGSRLALRGSAGPAQTLHVPQTYLTQYPNVAADYATGKIGGGSLSGDLPRRLIPNPVVTVVDLKKVPKKIRKKMSPFGPEHEGVIMEPHPELMTASRYESIMKGQLSDFPKGSKKYYTVKETEKNYILSPVKVQEITSSPRLRKSHEFLKTTFSDVVPSKNLEDYGEKLFKALPKEVKEGYTRKQESLRKLWELKRERLLRTMPEKEVFKQYPDFQYLSAPWTIA